MNDQTVKREILDGNDGQLESDDTVKRETLDGNDGQGWEELESEHTYKSKDMVKTDESVKSETSSTSMGSSESADWRRTLVDDHILPHATRRRRFINVMAERVEKRRAAGDDGAGSDSSIESGAPIYPHTEPLRLPGFERFRSSDTRKRFLAERQRVRAMLERPFPDIGNVIFDADSRTMLNEQRPARRPISPPNLHRGARANATHSLPATSNVNRQDAPTRSPQQDVPVSEQRASAPNKRRRLPWIKDEDAKGSG
ncbi:uncharacterized protein N0V89_011801 [Didymosphaeria variabile]|uniref:Uncharacterized protein n=1 Tax=Didymosphaeria variabile TaxID=1932322 RepID=A0A9W8XAR1_9PLEO|nr:uncharacterized protein N0V89_011801 [Didymosphaeria variabile]KAJ4345666.1 hypothetical protein N0V89_011801 [Didymosphaeria variabile]